MKHRSLAGAVAAAVMTGALFTASAHAAPPSALRLAEPGGGHQIGMVAMHLVDRDRADPWVPEERRELMVSVWYPARKPSGTPATYMTAAESRMYLEAAGVPVPPDVLSTVVTHATVGAEPLPTRRPLVLLSPGFGLPRATLTGLAEELASRGYIVAGIGHNYEANGITFPDGHTTGCVICANPDAARVGAVRAADVSFVLDELAWRYRKLIDTHRVAMVGHSAGGFSTIPAQLSDARIRAAVNMDGNFRYPNDTPLNRPMLMLGNPRHVPGGPDPTWDETWRELTGWKRWLSVEGMAHLSFTDVAPLAKQLDIPLQDLDGDRCDAITRAYVTAFADRHLRGRHEPLLDEPSARYPQVRFHQP